MIEKVGTGINRIRDAVRENGKSTVEFSFNEFFTVTYYRSKKESNEELTAREKTREKILSLIKENKYITASELAKELSYQSRVSNGSYRNLKRNNTSSALAQIKVDTGK
jgi:ATP-dependent DNA helicase RecG